MSKISEIFRKGWLQVLIAGIILFIAMEQTFILTGNINLFPAVLLLGALTIPLSFVVYIFSRERKLDLGIHAESPLVLVGVAFLAGGIIGVISASLLEYRALSQLNLTSLISVGLIEETGKLVVPLVVFIRGRYRTEIDGILVGVATGMGFAALETMGYGLVSFVQSSGNTSILEQVLLIRGLFSPVGHAAWTGFICAVLWRERIKRRGAKSVLLVIGAFLIAVLLHFMWNFSSFLSSASSGISILGVAGTLIIAALSLTFLILRIRESRKYSVIVESV